MAESILAWRPDEEPGPRIVVPNSKQTEAARLTPVNDDPSDLSRKAWSPVDPGQNRVHATKSGEPWTLRGERPGGYRITRNVRRTRYTGVELGQCPRGTLQASPIPPEVHPECSPPPSAGRRALAMCGGQRSRFTKTGEMPPSGVKTLAPMSRRRKGRWRSIKRQANVAPTRPSAKISRMAQTSSWLGRVGKDG